MTNNPLETMDKIEDLAKYLQLSVVTLRGWVRRGYIPANTYIRVAGTYRFDRAAVVRALKHSTPVAEPIEDPDPSPTQLNLFYDETTNTTGEL